MSVELRATATASHARAGVLHTARGSIETPVFMPVGTRGTVRTQLVSQLEALGTKKLSIPFDATGKQWVRFAMWDVAGNGAFTQPRWLTGGN